MPLQSCSLLWGLEMLSNCISISTRRVLVLVLVSAHARRKQGEIWTLRPSASGGRGYGSKPRGAAKQIRPYGAEGYILVSTNWLLWLAFRWTNMARSIGVKWHCTSTFSSLKHWSFLSYSEAPFTTLDKKATGNICKIVPTRPRRPDCVNHNSRALIHAADTSLVCAGLRYVH